MDTATGKEKDGNAANAANATSAAKGAQVKATGAANVKEGSSWKPWALALSLSILANVALGMGLANTKGELADVTGRLADAMITEDASRERYAALSSNVEGDQRAISDSRAIFEKVQRDLNGLTTRVAQIQAEAGEALETLYAAEGNTAAEAVSPEVVESEQAPDSLDSFDPLDSLDSLVESVETLVGVESSEESPADVPPAESVKTADLK